MAGFYGVVKTFRDIPVCGWLHAFHAVIQPLNAEAMRTMRNITKSRESAATRGSDPLGNAPSRGGGERKKRDAWERSSARKIELLFRFTPGQLSRSRAVAGVKSYGNLCGQ